MAARKKRPQRRRRTTVPEDKKGITEPPLPPLEVKAKEAVAQVLNRFAEDPEKALTDMGNLAKGAGKLLEEAYRHPEETKRTVRNAALSITAKLLKKGTEE